MTLLATVIFSVCSAVPSVSVASDTYEKFTLVGCPTPLRVAFPKEFRRAPSAHAVANKKACRYSWKRKGSYECLFQNWAPEVQLPRMEVTAWSDFAPHREPGKLDARTWRSIRSSIGGGASGARDARMERFIRNLEPSAPADGREFRERYAQFFLDTPDTAPSASSLIGTKGGFVSGGRFYYIHRCIFIVNFFVSYRSAKPVTTLNRYMERIIVK